MPSELSLDRDACLTALRSRDARFDGQFVTAVTSTGIYCRPSCPARTPLPENVRFLPTAAAAQQEGFRACKRCLPDAVPGSPQWDVRADLTARAMRMIGDGVVDREGVDGLARGLGYSVRQVQRHLRAELGAGPLALARARRAQTARTLLGSTSMTGADIAFAAGFASVRQFNDTVREVYGVAAGQLRAQARRGRQTAGEVHAGGPGTAAPLAGVDLRLPFRPPLVPDNLFGHLAATAVPGVEEWRDGALRVAIRLPHGHAIAALRPPVGGAGGEAWVPCRLLLRDLRDLSAAISRCRRLLDLDADPLAVDAHLADDPVLAPLVAAAPGRRVPRSTCAADLAVRAVLGQQVSTAAAATHAGRLAAAHGEPIVDPEGGLTRLFPTPAALAGVDPTTLALPRSRAATLLALAAELADGLDLGVGCDREEARRALAALPGVGPWTVEVVAMRGLGDPDAFCGGDLGVRAAARALGLPDSPAALAARSARWRPWRAYAVQHLWATGTHAVNRLPDPPPRRPGRPRTAPEEDR
ncbi:MAG: Ada metal-binding domain-containing protein [Kineosporiaceae bacterium]